MFFSGLLRFLFILAFSMHAHKALGDTEEDTRVDIEFTKDRQPIRVDCHNIPIIGDGIGGAQLACEERLTLYAEFRCFPMKKDTVEAKCPDWKGLQAEVDWEKVAELIDARVEKEELTKKELERQAGEYKQRMEPKEQ